MAPTIKELCEFLQTRCNMLASISLEVSGAKQLARSQTSRSTWSKPTNVTMLFAMQRNYQNPKCSIYRQSHHTFPCQKLLSADSARRMQLVKKAELCKNCLCQFHALKGCRASSCKLCQKRHNTLLHIDKPKEFLHQDNKCQDDPNHDNMQSTYTTTNVNKPNQVMLSTAMVEVKDYKGNYRKCRVLLDSASHSNFIIKQCCKRLKLPTQQINVQVTRTNNNDSHISLSIPLHFRDTIMHTHQFEASCLLVNSISDQLPQQDFPIDNMRLPRKL